MKKLSFILPLLAIPLLTGCDGNSTPAQLTYGTYRDTEAVYLSSSDFTTHVENNENFLLAIYPKDSTCSCWRNFSRVIKETMTEDHLLIYSFHAEDVDDNPVMKEIGGFNNRKDAPTFYIVKDKKIAKYYNFSSSSGFFKNKDVFMEELSTHIKKPKMYYISLEGLDEKLANKDSFSIFYARNKCSDCNFVIPHTLSPYLSTLDETKKDLYVVDLQSYYEGDKAEYQEIKDKYLLSEKNNPELGLGNGVIPTFQYYKEGSLYDMCIYANDGALTKEGDYYYAKNSYYNETRLAKFHYLDGVETKDLTKVQIKEEETTKDDEKVEWDIEYSSVYYDPILKGFLNTYL